jgi:hypothetical protein
MSTHNSVNPGIFQHSSCAFRNPPRKVIEFCIVIEGPPPERRVKPECLRETCLKRGLDKKDVGLKYQ